MKKLSLILVALATMVMVGCKPLTGSTVCTHDWVDTDDTKVTSAKYYLNDKGELTFKTVEVSPKYKCSICGEEHEKTIAFFDSPTTIGVATEVSYHEDEDTGEESYILPLNDTWTVEKYNSYYDEVVKNKGKSGYISYCNCKCIHDVGKGNTCSCVDDCTCGDPDNCVRSSGNYVFFGSYDIEY